MNPLLDLLCFQHHVPSCTVSWLYCFLLGTLSRSSDPPESDSLAPVQSEESRDEVEDGSMSSEKEVLTAKEMAREKDEVEVEVMETESPPSEDDDISKVCSASCVCRMCSVIYDTAKHINEQSQYTLPPTTYKTYCAILHKYFMGHNYNTIYNYYESQR